MQWVRAPWTLESIVLPVVSLSARSLPVFVEAMLEELGSGGGASMTWPEFVDFFRQTGAATAEGQKLFDSEMSGLVSDGLQVCSWSTALGTS